MLAVTGAAGCTKSNEQVAAAALADPALQALLSKIPADTPYLVVTAGDGSIRPMIEKMYKGMGPLFDKLGPMIDGMKLDGESGPLIRAILQEFKALTQEGGIDRLGIDFDGRHVIYGIGVLPATRWALKDPQAVRDLLGRIQQGGGVTIPVCKLGDAEYWCGEAGPVKIGAAIVSNELVLGFAPASMADKVFELLFGKTAPERSLADSSKLRELMTRWELGKHSVGYVDARVITESLLGEGDPLNKEVLAALSPKLAEEWPKLTQVCKDEVRGLVGVAPLLVFGAEAISAEGFESVFGVELRSDIAQEFKSLRASVPGLTKELRQDALFAMGGGADVGKAIEVVLRKAGEVRSSPYQCPELAKLNELAQKVGQDTSAIPKWVPQLRGANLVLTDLKMSGFLPTSINAYGVLATGDPRGVYEAIRAESPQVSAYEFSDDGTVHKVPDGTVPFVNGIAYGAKAGVGFAVAIGEDSEKKVSSLLAGGEVKDPPLALFAYDLGKIMGLLEPVMGMAGQPDLTALMGVYKMFGPAGYEVYADDRGLVFKAGMKLH